MIAFKAVANVLQVAQEISSPSVYLDHWALREISESSTLASRFTNAIHIRKGTLVLSWLNVVEFSRVSDQTQRSQADDMINRLGPHLFWLNPDFWVVSQN